MYLGKRKSFLIDKVTIGLEELVFNEEHLTHTKK